MGNRSRRRERANGTERRRREIRSTIVLFQEKRTRTVEKVGSIEIEKYRGRNRCHERMNKKADLMISQTLFLLKRYGNSTIFTRDIYSANNVYRTVRFLGRNTFT